MVRNWPVWITFIFGALLMVVVFHYWSENQHIAAERDFLAQSRDFNLALDDRIITGVQDVRSIQAFYNSSSTVTQEQFSSFVTPLLNYGNTVFAAAWVPKVTKLNQTNLVSRMHFSAANFRFKRLGENHQMVEDTSDQYPKYPIEYIIPSSLFPSIGGYDLGSDSTRLAAINLANSTGEITFSAPLQLATSSSRNSGYILLAPIYKKDLGTRLHDTEVKELKGFVVAASQIDKLIINLRKRLKFKHLNITVDDVSDNANPIRVYGHSLVKSSAYFSTHLSVQLLNRQWQVHYQAPVSIYISPYTWVSYVVLLTAFLALVILCVYIWTIVNRASHIRKLVAQRTAELERVNNALTEEMGARQIEQEKLAKAIITDSLCQLPNRFAFDKALQLEIKAVSENQHVLTLLYIDLDHFKDINDTYGHDFGDRLLVHTANVFREFAHEGDFIARLGSDEFALIHPHQQIDGERERYAKEISDALNASFSVDDLLIDVKCSIGAVTFPEAGNDSASLMKYADIALVRAKQAHRGGVVFFDESLYDKYLRRMRILQDLPVAIERNEIYMVYQPQLDMRDNKLVGAEVLMRWQHGSLGAISPAEFIPLAEESGMILELGLWAIEATCIQCQKWLKGGFAVQSMSVNVSPLQLLDPKFVDHYFSILDLYGLNKNVIKLELTESDLMGYDNRLKSVLNDLAQQGTHIYIDDFGTGSSSLARLKDLPVSGLKIDTSFVADALKDRGSATIIKAIIALAQQLNLDLVAEGVETVEQKDFLLQQGCYVAQGYYYSKPISSQEMSKYF